MPMGVLRAPSGKYFIFAPGAGIAGNPPQGTYKFVGTLDHFVPAKRGANNLPQPSMVLGRLQPSPDGSDFDRDYGGGGPVYLSMVP